MNLTKKLYLNSLPGNIFRNLSGGFMQQRWLTGKEITNTRGVAHIELGQACFGGQLTAYFQSAWGPIHDISKLPRVPKYPPLGVDQMDHVQTGETVYWDWDQILGIDVLQSEARNMEAWLPDAISVWKAKNNKTILSVLGSNSELPPCSIDIGSIPKYDLSPPKTRDIGYGQPKVKLIFSKPENHFKDYSFNDLDKIIKSGIKKHNDILRKIRQKKGISIQANVDAQTMAAKAGAHKDTLYEEAQTIAWEALMPSVYLWVENNQLFETADLNDRLFYFDFDMFIRMEKKLADSFKQPFSLQLATTQYCQKIEKLWFSEQEFSAWHTSLSSPQTTPDDSQDACEIKRWEEIIPRLTNKDADAARIVIAKWKGKTHEEAYDEVFHGTVVKNKIQAVSKRLARAKKIAQNYSLGMPN